MESEEDDEPAGHSEPLLRPDEIFDTATLQETLRRVIRDLPPRQREALILWTRHGMTLTELGEALGISHVAARKLLLKAQTTLQAVLD